MPAPPAHSPLFLYTPPLKRPQKFLEQISLTSPYRDSGPPIIRPITPPSPSPGLVNPQTVSRMKTLSSLPTNGKTFALKKAGDPMSFDFRNRENGKVRYPSDAESKLLFDQFPDLSAYEIRSPFIILQTSSPSPSRPLTVAGLPAIFVTDLRESRVYIGDLGNPALPDFGQEEFTVTGNVYPSFDLVEKAYRLFSSQLKGVQSVAYQLDSWLVELLPDTPMTNLPGKFGRRPVRYAYSSEMRKYSRPRAIFPTQSQEDDTDYRASGPLTPGVKVTGLSMSSTAGVLLQHNDGRQRVTVALHAFYDSHSVFHPNRLPRQYLGEIRERYYGPDIGLCELSPGNQFSNVTYFNANPPKRLVDTAYASEYIDRTSWFEVDGYTGGKITLLYEGPRVRKRDLPEEIINMHSLSIQRDYMFQYCGIDEVEMKSGICGAPIVHEPSADSELDGVVLGFFFLNEGPLCFVPYVDRVVSDGWQIA